MSQGQMPYTEVLGGLGVPGAAVPYGLYRRSGSLLLFSSARISRATPSSCSLLAQDIRSARFLAALKAGNNIAARMAMMAMTTRSSIKVKASGRLLAERDIFMINLALRARGKQLQKNSAWGSKELETPTRRTHAQRLYAGPMVEPLPNYSVTAITGRIPPIRSLAWSTDNYPPTSSRPRWAPPPESKRHLAPTPGWPPR